MPDKASHNPRRFRVPEGTCVYAVGDIHGKLEVMRQLHEKILEDKDKRAADRFVLVYLGDYVDRGDKSREVLEELITAPLTGFELVHLLGNHEYSMLQFMDKGGLNAAWLQWGGLATLTSYGIGSRGLFGEIMEPYLLAEDFQRTFPAHHRAWLESLPYYHQEGDYLFVHAGINPEVSSIEEQTPHDLMTMREDFFQHPDAFDHAIVFGHTIFESPLNLPDRIGIDTGAFSNGRLTALVLHHDKREFISTEGIRTIT